MASNPSSPVNLHFGIGVEEDDDLNALTQSSHAKHPTTMQDKVDCILAYVEQMQVTTHDNNAILHQLMRTMEERMNKKIEDMRSEMVELIEKKFTEQQHTSLASGHAHRASPAEVKAKADKYKAPVASPRTAEHYYEMVDINPHPGFVIKTRKLIDGKNKVFINVFHHELIALTPPGLSSEKARDKPYMMMEDPTTTVDHAGISCMTFNVGISSEYFSQQANPDVDINITAPSTIYKMIHKVNLKFNEFLDEGNYSIPRLATGFKGENPPVFKVPQLKDPKDRTLRHTRSLDGGKAGENKADSAPVKPTGIAGIWAATMGKHEKNDEKNENNNKEDGKEDKNGTKNDKNNEKNDKNNENNTDVETVKPFNPDEDTLAPLPNNTNNNINNNNTNNNNHNNSKPASRRGSENNINDTDSVTSDITTNTVQPTNTATKAPRRASLAQMVGLAGSANNLHGKITRKSVLVSTGSAGYNGGAIQGRNLLSGDMLEYHPSDNVGNEEAEGLKSQANEDPTVLLGWQIWFQGDSKIADTNTIYVVTDVRKNYLSKTEFRLSKYKEDDQWVKLKRQEGKSGAEFRPMRKVLFGLCTDDETVA